MLISIEKLKSIYTDKDFSKFSDDRLLLKMEAIETAIRRYTHNKFQNRNIRAKVYVSNGIILGDLRYFNLGDTIMISSGINEGLYTLISVEPNAVETDKTLYDVEEMLITKVEYPADVIDGCVELLDYDVNRRAQVASGIASESISRHSVSYKQYSDANTIEGYPSEMLGFLRKYCEWQT